MAVKVSIKDEALRSARALETFQDNPKLAANFIARIVIYTSLHGCTYRIWEL